MKTYRWILFGTSIMLLAAIYGLLLGNPDSALASGPVCAGSNCTITDTSVADFSPGTFVYTGVRNVGDGEVQLRPIGITGQWITDTHRIFGGADGLADTTAVIYNDIIYVIGGYDNESNNNSEVFTATTTVTGPLGSAWRTASHMPSVLSGMTAVISPTNQNNAFLYVLGGTTNFALGPSAYSANIYFTTITANGAIGSWITSTLPLTTEVGFGRVYAQAVVHDGNLYVIGGLQNSFGANQVLKSIFHAPINPSTGDLIGPWVQDSDFSATARQLMGSVIGSTSGGDYLYVIGGTVNGSTGLNEVDYALFTGSTLTSTFTSSGADLPLPYFYHNAVQASGLIYATGGDPGPSDPSHITNTVQIALIQSDGSLQAFLGGQHWLTSNPLPQGRKAHGTVINSGGIVYVIGGNALAGQGSSGGDTTDTVYYGSTQGIASQYAPSGIFTSHIIGLPGIQTINSLVANTTLTDTTNSALSLQYRASSLSQADLIGQPWSSFTTINTGDSVSTTLTLTPKVDASFIQYRAVFTLTHYSTVNNISPLLNAFQIVYDHKVYPDFTITGLTAPPAFSSPPVTHTQIITYWVIDKQAPSAPVRRAPVVTTSPKVPKNPAGPLKVPPPPTLAGSSPSRVTAPQSTKPTFLFYVYFYADPIPVPTAPMSVTNALSCIDINNPRHDYTNGPFLPFIYYNPLMGTELFKTAVYTFYAQCTVPASTQDFWAQIDACNSTDVPDCTTNGYVLEADETSIPPSYLDNIRGPVPAGTSNGGGGGTGGLIQFLPLIRRSP